MAKKRAGTPKKKTVAVDREASALAKKALGLAPHAKLGDPVMEIIQHARVLYNNMGFANQALPHQTVLNCLVLARMSVGPSAMAEDPNARSVMPVMEIWAQVEEGTKVHAKTLTKPAICTYLGVSKNMPNKLVVLTPEGGEEHLEAFRVHLKEAADIKRWPELAPKTSKQRQLREELKEEVKKQSRRDQRKKKVVEENTNWDEVLPDSPVECSTARGWLPGKFVGVREDGKITCITDKTDMTLNLKPDEVSLVKNLADDLEDQIRADEDAQKANAE